MQHENRQRVLSFARQTAESAANPDAGIAGVWAWDSDGRRPSGPRYGSADGCTYLLFGFGAARAGQRGLIHARLIGPRTQPFVIDDRPRLCVGVRIVPGFAQAAFGMPASELLDQRVDYGLVYADADADLEHIRAAETDAERLANVLALARRRFQSVTRIPSSLRVALAHIEMAGGNVRIGSLVDHIGVTRQHLARQFAAHVGMTAKQFARIKRAEVARALATDGRATPSGKVNWSMIAHQVGYYDQAHFIRDYKAFTGSTPGKWTR
jgi:AraC-like DNA-binding protein